MSVPLFDFKAQTATLSEQLRAAFDRVLASGQFINGPEVEGFEKSFAQYLQTGGGQTSGTLGLSSGTDALVVPLMAEGVGPGDEILLPSFTFFATAGSVARLGAKPVFVDIDPKSYNLCPKDLMRKYTPRCRGVIPVHLFGQSADLLPILAFAHDKKMFVLEDVAQAVGGTYDGKQLGTLGEWGAYSFFPTKNLGALGDAGALCARDPQRLQMAKWLRNHGDISRYEHQFVGGNFRLDALQAAFLREKLALLNAWIDKRRANAARYHELLKDVRELTLPSEMHNCRHTYNQFTVRVKNGKRDALKEALSKAGIGCQVYYPIPLHRQKCFEASANECHETDRACAEVLSLPIYPELTAAQQDEVVQALKNFFAGKLVSA